MSRTDHWDSVYRTKADVEVSWYEPTPTLSLELIHEVLPSPASIIDVGGGSSRLVDELLEQTAAKISVLDISAVALERVRTRLGDLAKQVHWIVADVATPLALGPYDVWHDRAVFHFLTDPQERVQYVRNAAAALPSGTHAIIGTFAADGPMKCSGLSVQRYDADQLAHEFATDFQLVRSRVHQHETPWCKPQTFQFVVLRRI